MGQTRKSAVQARVVPLTSPEASDAFVAGTPSERIALVAELSRRAWALTGQPLPSYTRATMPVRVVTLAESGSGA
ncbi:hypothetical protein BH23GEM2_BH23GEM2_20280 [soil metagenome]